MFLFRGDRKYLQSSDIFSFIFNNFDFTTLDLHFHRFLTSQPRIKITKKWKKSFYKANIVGKIKIKNEYKYILFYQTKEKINNSYSFDENLLKKFIKIKKNKVSIKLQTSIIYMDLIVLISKLWHLSKINNKKKWIVTRINLEKKYSESLEKNIVIENEKIINQKFSISKILINNKILGKIFYTHTNDIYRAH